MKKKILYLIAPILLVTACTTSFGVGSGIGIGRGGGSVSVGASKEIPIKKKDDKKATENKIKEKPKTTVKKPSPKKVVEQNIIKTDKTDIVDTTKSVEDTSKTGKTVKRIKQERQE